MLAAHLSCIKHVCVPMHMPKDGEVMYREGCKTEHTNLGEENRHTSTNKRVGYVEKGCYSINGHTKTLSECRK